MPGRRRALEAEARAEEQVQMAEEQVQMAEEQVQMAEEQVRVAEEQVRVAEEQARTAEERGEYHGEVRALQETLVRMLSRKFGELPPEVVSWVRAASELHLLEDWLDRILEASSLAEMGLERDRVDQTGRDNACSPRSIDTGWFKNKIKNKIRIMMKRTPEGDGTCAHVFNSGTDPGAGAGCQLGQIGKGPGIASEMGLTGTERSRCLGRVPGER